MSGDMIMIDMKPDENGTILIERTESLSGFDHEFGLVSRSSQQNDEVGCQASRKHSSSTSVDLRPHVPVRKLSMDFDSTASLDDWFSDEDSITASDVGINRAPTLPSLHSPLTRNGKEKSFRKDATQEESPHGKDSAPLPFKRRSSPRPDSELRNHVLSPLVPVRKLSRDLESTESFEDCCSDEDSIIASNVGINRAPTLLSLHSPLTRNGKEKSLRKDATQEESPHEIDSAPLPFKRRSSPRPDSELRKDVQDDASVEGDGEEETGDKAIPTLRSISPLSPKADVELRKTILDEEPAENGVSPPPIPRRSVSITSALEKLAHTFADGVCVGTHTYHLRRYRNTFVGKEAVDFMLQANLAATREDAIFLGQRFFKEMNLFYHVCFDHTFKDG